MRLCFISDTHRQHRRLLIPKCDILFHCGDITSKGELRTLADFNTWLGELKQSGTIRHSVTIAGNHEVEASKVPGALKTILTNTHYLENSGIELEGLRIWGSPMSNKFKPEHWAFQLDPERHRGFWDQIPEGTDIVLTHGPPYLLLDQTEDGRHIGNNELADRLFQIQPQIAAFGHCHEAHGERFFLGTHYINAAVLNERYELLYYQGTSVEIP